MQYSAPSACPLIGAPVQALGSWGCDFQAVLGTVDSSQYHWTQRGEVQGEGDRSTCVQRLRPTSLTEGL